MLWAGDPATPVPFPEEDLTYELLGPDSKWSGNLCFNDGHISREGVDLMNFKPTAINNGLGL